MNTSKKVLPVIIALLAGATSVQAANDDESWYFAPSLSYIKADDDRMSDDGLGVMLGFGTPVSESWNIEFSFAMDSLDFESTSGEYDQKALIVDGLYFFNRGEGLQTYAVVGAGVMSTDLGATDTTNPMANVGVGIMQTVTDGGMKLRADIRYRMDMDDESIATEDDFGDMMLNVGLAIPFGGETQAAKPAPKAAKAMPKDSDNDGVYDSSDRCPGTAAGVKVDARGCAVVVNNDTDNDGVLNSNDRCPNSKAGVNVDVKGCELQQSFVLEGVNFVTGSDALTSGSKSVLNEVAETLIKNSDINVEVAGYTDDRGSAASNQRLSQKRAQSVKAYLAQAGVNADRMSAKGFGESDPIADNNTKAGRAKNRRVELHIKK